MQFGVQGLDFRERGLGVRGFRGKGVSGLGFQTFGWRARGVLDAKLQICASESRPLNCRIALSSQQRRSRPCIGDGPP